MAEENEVSAERGTSRRQALKVALGAGIGVAAWSGPTITSLGGTPVYAAACTSFSTQEDLTDRNTNQGGGSQCSLQYQQDDLTIDPTHVIALPIPNGGHCNATRLAGTFTFPVGEYCRLEVRVHATGNYSSGPYNIIQSFEGDGPSFAIYLPSNADYNTYFADPSKTNKTNVVNANSRYSIRVECVTDANKACFITP